MSSRLWLPDDDPRMLARLKREQAQREVARQAHASGEVVYGWRAWWLERESDIVLDGQTGEYAMRDAGLRLKSWSQSYVWEPRVRAEYQPCFQRDDRLLDSLGEIRVDGTNGHPRMGLCQCGFYALKTAGHLMMELATDSGARNLARPLVFGRIAMWGRWVEHEDGWRSQYAYPYDLVVVDGSEALVRALANTYAVDVRAMASGPNGPDRGQWLDVVKDEMAKARERVFVIEDKDRKIDWVTGIAANLYAKPVTFTANGGPVEIQGPGGPVQLGNGDTYSVTWKFTQQ